MAQPMGVYSASIGFDRRLAPYDIAVSIAGTPTAMSSRVFRSRRRRPLPTLWRGEEERGEVVIPPSITLVSQEHNTPFTMVTELEGRLSSLDRVTSVTVFLQGKGVEEARRLEELLSGLKDKASTNVELTIRINLHKATAKEELLRLLGSFPIPTDGIIRADLEVQRDEPR